MPPKAPTQSRTHVDEALLIKSLDVSPCSPTQKTVLTILWCQGYEGVLDCSDRLTKNSITKTPASKSDRAITSFLWRRHKLSVFSPPILSSRNILNLFEVKRC